MSTLRDNYNPAKLYAAMLLDRVRNGDTSIPQHRINEALAVLGEPI
jgi:hypothetical protein